LLNPLNDFGLPFLAQWNTMTLYPGSLIYLLFPLSWSLGIFCLAHLFLGGMEYISSPVAGRVVRSVERWREWATPSTVSPELPDLAE